MELRRYARLKAAVDVQYRMEGAQKAPKARTKSVNISVGGICFEVPDRCRIGARLSMEIFLKPDEPVKVEGNIIWHNKLQDGSHRVGVRFEGLKEEESQRFSDFIFNKMYEMTGMGNRAGLIRYAKEHGWKKT
jgi:c-di-GMP-binding flagellar brake protein YcgR